jgi:hypothetical protein
LGLLINRVADDALRVILPKASAGACVPDNGQLCRCVAYNTCEPSGQIFWETYRYNCHGQCVHQRRLWGSLLTRSPQRSCLRCRLD